MENGSVYLDSWDANGCKSRVKFIDAPLPSHSRRQRRGDNMSLITDNCLWRIFSGDKGKYVVIGTFVFVVVVSYLMSTVPDDKTNATRELDCIKQFLKVLSVEVNRVEKSCMTTAKDIRLLQQYSARNVGTETPPALRYKPVDATTYVKNSPDATWLDEHISFLRQFALPHQNSSKKEITIMSYIYTNSFGKEKSNDTSMEK